jgi:hypothetical protein
VTHHRTTRALLLFGVFVVFFGNAFLRVVMEAYIAALIASKGLNTPITIMVALRLTCVFFAVPNAQSTRLVIFLISTRSKAYQKNYLLLISRLLKLRWRNWSITGKVAYVRIVVHWSCRSTQPSLKPTKPT